MSGLRRLGRVSGSHYHELGALGTPAPPTVAPCKQLMGQSHSGTCSQGTEVRGRDPLSAPLVWNMILRQFGLRPLNFKFLLSWSQWKARETVTQSRAGPEEEWGLEVLKVSIADLPSQRARIGRALPLDADEQLCRSKAHGRTRQHIPSSSGYSSEI